ncbi:MAG TPA: Spy/CpxP family protein refolding chaperone [Vicinamibacterales bacterium]|nr:Spy/CpxP family protein refolding chaperone [Vicinamibacterales bacterium]
MVGTASAQGRDGRGQDRKGPSATDSRNPRSDPRPPQKWWADEKIQQELKLTSQQAAAIEKVFQASMEQLRVDKDVMDRYQTEFSKLMDQPTAAERDFTRAVNNLEMARYNVSKERTLMLVRIHSILTPDQRKGLETIRKRNDADKNRPH